MTTEQFITDYDFPQLRLLSIAEAIVAERKRLAMETQPAPLSVLRHSGLLDVVRILPVDRGEEV